MIAVALAVLRRDWEIERTYRLSLVLTFLSTVWSAIGLYFFGQLVTDPAALGNYEGGYFEFALVGIAIVSFASVGVKSFSGSLVNEQATGTIDLLLSSPASRPGLLSGLFLLPFGLATAQFLILLGIGIGVLGTGLPAGGLLLCLPILLLTTATFAAMGIASAGVLMVAKRGDPISGLVIQLTTMLSGAVYPIDVLPRFLQVVAKLLPATWGISACRELLLGGASFTDVLPEVGVLAAFTVIMLPLSLVAFRRCVGIARRRGLLGSY
jgi:ABC-2 type transport system permease protein